jgi:hypothetical protein
MFNWSRITGKKWKAMFSITTSKVNKPHTYFMVQVFHNRNLSSTLRFSFFVQLSVSFCTTIPVPRATTILLVVPYSFFTYIYKSLVCALESVWCDCEAVRPQQEISALTYDGRTLERIVPSPHLYSFCLLQGVSALGSSCPSRRTLLTTLSLLLDWSCQQLNHTEKGFAQALRSL